MAQSICLGHSGPGEVILKDDVARRAEHHVDVIRVRRVREVCVDVARVVLLGLQWGRLWRVLHAKRITTA